MMMNNPRKIPPSKANNNNTLEEVYNKYQSQPQTDEEWEEMNNAIKAAVIYENSLPNGPKYGMIRLAKTDETSGSPQ